MKVLYFQYRHEPAPRRLVQLHYSAWGNTIVLFLVIFWFLKDFLSILAIPFPRKGWGFICLFYHFVPSRILYSCKVGGSHFLSSIWQPFGPVVFDKISLLLSYDAMSSIINLHRGFMMLLEPLVHPATPSTIGPCRQSHWVFVSSHTWIFFPVMSEGSPAILLLLLIPVTCSIHFGSCWSACSFFWVLLVGASLHILISSLWKFLSGEPGWKWEHEEVSPPGSPSVLPFTLHSVRIT